MLLFQRPCGGGLRFVVPFCVSECSMLFQQGHNRLRKHSRAKFQDEIYYSHKNTSSEAPAIGCCGVLCTPDLESEMNPWGALFRFRRSGTRASKYLTYRPFWPLFLSYHMQNVTMAGLALVEMQHKYVYLLRSTRYSERTYLAEHEF